MAWAAIRLNIEFRELALWRNSLALARLAGTGVAFRCPGLTALVPAQAIADALANPARVGGWGQPCNPSLPPGPHNPTRTTLGLRTVGKPYHPVFNGLVFKCGCP